jgi:hypothetical protein
VLDQGKHLEFDPIVAILAGLRAVLTVSASAGTRPARLGEVALCLLTVLG